MPFEQLAQEVRLGARALRRSRGFTIAAVLTLAVGVAGTTVMYALAQGVLLRRLPVRDQDRLLISWAELPGSGDRRWPHRRQDIDEIVAGSRTFEGLAGYGYNSPGQWTLTEGTSTTAVSGAPVTGDFFRVLGATPLLGRALTRDDDRAGAEPALVLTNRLWQRRFGGSGEVIGRTVMIRQSRYRIVGVMPPDVEFPRGVEAWTTIAAAAATASNDTSRMGVSTEVYLIGRIRQGATLAQAASELATITRQLQANAEAGAPDGLRPAVQPYVEAVVGDLRRPIAVLFGAVALVLLIASANVANLLLMRGEARRREFAVRTALGAGRARLARQILVESVILALAAGLAGVTVAWWSVGAIAALVPDGLSRIEAVRVDAGVVTFTVAIAFVTALLSGLAPALLTVRANLLPQLHAGGRGTTGAAATGRRMLVVAQVALGVTVVAAAGLLTRSLVRLQSAETGMALERLFYVPLEMPDAKYDGRDRRLQFLDEVTSRIESTPGIIAATPVNNAPFSGIGWDVPVFTAEGQDATTAEANPSLHLEAIHPNYFTTFDIAITRGRGFVAADRQGAPSVAVISEDAAARTWPAQDPIGKRIKMGGIDATADWLTIVGVARGTRYRELAEVRPTLYLPAEQMIVTAGSLVVRTALPETAVTAAVRQQVGAVDPAVQVLRATPFADMRERPLARPRFNALLLVTFASAALVLSAVGLYGVMAAFVRQRYVEIGVRIALGATRSDIRRLVLGEGVRLAAAGAALGLAGALAATRSLQGLLFEVHPLDPWSLAGAALTLVAMSALVTYLPARRAARLEPIATLRAE